jgi:hypothetical protein
MHQDFPAIDRVLSRFKSKLLNARTEDCTSNFTKECELEDCHSVKAQSDDSLDGNDSLVEYSLLGFLDRHSVDPLFVRVDYSHLRGLVEQWVLNNCLVSSSLARRQPYCTQEINSFGKCFVRAVRLKHFFSWSCWVKHRKDMKQRLTSVEQGLWSCSFLSNVARLRCVQRFGKAKVAELYCRWRIFRQLLTAFLRNYVN